MSLARGVFTWRKTRSLSVPYRYLKFSCARQPTARTPRDYRSVLNNFAAGSLLMRFVFQAADCNAVAVAAFQEWPLILSVSSLTSVKKLALPRSTAVFSLFSGFCFFFSNVVIILLNNDVSMNKIIYEHTRNLDIFIMRRKRTGISKMVVIVVIV